MNEHEELQSDLPALALDRLQGEPRRRLEEHVAGCENCSVLIETARGIAESLREDGEALLSPHPGVLILKDYAARGPERLPTEVARHVALCDSCALEVSAWKQDAGARVPREAERSVPTRSRGWAAAVAGVAAGVVLGILAARLSGIPVASRHGRPAEAQASPVHVLSLFGSFRGGESDPVLTIVPGQSQVPINVYLESFEPSDRMGALEFRIRSGDGRLAWSAVCPPERAAAILDGDGVFGLLVSVGDLRPGVYELTAGVFKDAAPPLVQRRFKVEMSQH